ncbi:hypothetical protein N7505_007459 [Penicillium chrysogenum]|uniref:S-adenosyl-L-methionine-dependent methyltransferase n=1 Tax=Penicillium chrysogenum TaxID=5076 RepID=A0ABQ8WDF0_PENCH|nr:hypothetical protein N7505_007459 [Penicillium chrysogenum]
MDPDFYSMATGYGTDPQDFHLETTSIASTIARGRLESGRRYQAIKEDDYWGPSDEQQFEAFEIGSQSTESSFRAPIGDSPKNILDIGTGQGSWAIDVADLYPSGIGYRPRRGYIPPTRVMDAPELRLEVDDVLREWTWRESFDFIHMRLMYGAFSPEGWDKLYKQAYECSERAGRSLRTHETMRSAIEKTGFVDVHEERYKIPLGPWPKDTLLKEAGHLQYAHWNAVLEGWAMWLLTHFGEPEPWMKEEVQVFLAEVRVELKNPHIHAYEPANRVWARKPTKEQLKAKEAKIKVETLP